MPGLEIENAKFWIRVERDGQLSSRAMPEGTFQRQYALSEGQIGATEAAPVEGLLRYDLPCIFESVVVRLEGNTAPVLQNTIGHWPEAVDDDQLDMYPHLHYLEERKTGIPWRFERWYTLAGPYLVLESEQYFERPRPVTRGKNWERFIVQLRQVMDLAG
jgi:hypothetical protein